MEDARGSSLRNAADFRLPTTFADVSNLDGNHQPFGANDRRRLFAIGNRLWHSDSSFKTIPAKYSLLRAMSIPSRGGNTEFAHMGAAYEALDDETKALIEDLVCEHSQLYSRESIGFTEFTPEERERFKPVRQRLVRTLPRTGRKSIYLSSHAGKIVGWQLPEARLLLRDLTEHATQRQFVYSHPWQLHDLVMWDNRQTMHRARPFPADEPRDMRRTTLKGEAPTVVEPALA
jgi:alpha-ketoglutarate-dependent 2,4-dichlorophenoxyacetate dioxygenase